MIFKTENNIRELAAGYKLIKKSKNGFYASAKIPFGENVVSNVTDSRSLIGSVLSMDRDEYLDWATSSYAELYLYTKDRHYLNVAQILLHDTKSMVAVPGHLHGLKGIGWQQEHWGMGPNKFGRGVGSHRFWLPWVTANHSHSITGLEELDPVLFKQLTK